MSSALQPLAAALTRAFLPLRLALEDDSGTRLMVLVRQLGWHVDLATCMTSLPIVSQLPPLILEAEHALEELSHAEDYGSAVASILDLVLGEGGIVPTLEKLSQSPPTAASVPATLADPKFWIELAADLPEYLLVRYLEVYQPLIYGAMRVLGLIVETEVDPGGAFGDARDVFIKREIVLSKCFELLSDPLGYLRHEYGWERENGVSKFDTAAAARLQEQLRLALRGVGLHVRTGEIRQRFCGNGQLFAATSTLAPSLQELALLFVHGRMGDAGWVEQGLSIFPIPERPGDSQVAGLYVGNLSWGAAHVEVDLSEAWKLVVEGGLDATGALGVVLLPERAATLRADSNANASLTLEVLPKSSGPWRLYGGEQGTRLESHGARVAACLSLASGKPNLELSLATLAPSGEHGLTFIIEPGEGDAFVGELLGTAPIEATFDAELSWSLRDGFRFEGAAGVEFVVPINKAVGPVYLDQVAVRVEVGTHGLTLDAGLTASAELGPFVLIVDGIGLRTQLTEVGHGSGLAVAKFGDVEITIDFKPPDGVGVSLDAGVATGGGYLRIDSDAGSYSGIVELKFLTFGLTAIGILNTKLPDGSKGWALLLSICAEFAPIPLGFGFTLNGVGGLIGVNRSMDTDVLAAAIPDGSIDWILFPDDPIANAPALIAGMNAAFPIRKGSFVLGPMVQIGWGVPTIVEISAGILVTLPDPIEIALIGQLDIVLGTDEVALLELHADLLGTLDFEAGEIAIFSNIRHSSNVVGIPLQGSMAFVADFVGNPYFLLSFGGFNPDYNPPVPLPFQMARMGFELDLDEIQISLGSYFAVTSNSVQFGSEFSIVAKAMGFTAEGACYFHVLFMFDPLELTAKLGFEISVSAGSWQLLAVLLDLTITGPNRWKGTGTATFKFLGKGIDFRVSGSFGKHEPTTPLPRVDVAEKLRLALAEPEAWAGLAPARGVVRVREVPTVTQAQGNAQPQPIHWVWPDGRVEIKQNVAPLGVALEQFGNAKISGDTTLSIDAPRLAGEDYGSRADRLEDYFAPAEFFELGKNEKLSSPGFQLMDAGRVFGGEGVQAGSKAEVEMSYEEWTWVTREQAPKKAAAPVPAQAAQLQRGLAGSLAQRLANIRSGGGRFRRAASSIALTPEAFVVANTRNANVDTTLTPSEGVRQIEAVLARKRLTGVDARAHVVLPKAESGRQAS